MLKVLRKKGFRQFVIRTTSLFAILLAVQLFIFLYFSKTQFFKKFLLIPTDFYFPFLQGLSKQDFLNSAIFVIVAFLLWRRKDIINFRAFRQNVSQTIIFGALASSVLISHYFFKHWVKTNLNFAYQNLTSITLLKYGFDLAFVLLLAFAIYNIEFIGFFARKFYKDLIFFSVVLFLYYKLIGWFQDSWLFFSVTVGKVLRYVFSKFFDNVVFYMTPQSGPVIGVGSFRVGISKVCSGIDSLLFFISLFVILIVLNWKELDKKRMAVLFVPGVIGTFIVNIIRVFLIILIGQKYPQFAVDLFHTNAGWILFLAYFIGFWHFGSKWVLKNGKKN